MIFRLSRVAAVVAVIGACAVWGGTAPANAELLTSFSMHPSSGPGGTAVTVRGTGCAPGLLLSSLDRVVVSVATVPSVSRQFAVNSSGSWSGTVTIPSNAATGQAAVAALCFSDGLPSLLTIYDPKPFTVTAAAVPTTTTPGTTPSTTVPVKREQPPPTTAPRTPPTTSPPRGAQPNGGTSTPGAPGGGGGGTTVPGGGSAGPGGTAAPRHASPATHGSTAFAADLATPGLAAADLSSSGGSGLGWIGWLALALLLAGLVTGALLFRRLRHDEPAPA